MVTNWCGIFLLYSWHPNVCMLTMRMMFFLSVLCSSIHWYDDIATSSVHPFSASKLGDLTNLWWNVTLSQIALRNIQTELADSPLYLTSAGHSQVFEQLFWHVVFTSKYFEVCLSLSLSRQRAWMWIGRSRFDSRHTLAACGSFDGVEVKDVLGRPGARVGVGSAR